MGIPRSTGTERRGASMASESGAVSGPRDHRYVCQHCGRFAKDCAQRLSLDAITVDVNGREGGE